jgi:hypothetical protein
MTNISRAPGHSAGPVPTTAAASTLASGASGSTQPAPDQDNPPALRRRTATGHVAGTQRPGSNPSRRAGLPPRPPSLVAGSMPVLIQGLAMREQEVATAIVAVRGRTLQLADAERQLPGLSRLIGTTGHWNTLGELRAVAGEVAAAGYPDTVLNLIRNVMTRIAGRRIGSAETSAAGARPAAPAHPAQAATGEAGPSAPREPAGPVIEIPEGLDLSELDAKWWQPPPPEGPAR